MKKGREQETTKKRILAFVFVLSMFAGAAWAQDESEAPIPETGKVFNLGEVVVSGEGEAVNKIATTEIVDEERIDLTTSKNVSDALDTLPGVFLTIGARNERMFTVRGFNQRYVPIFYDGIPIYVPYDGYIDAGKLPTSSISQIVLTKGNSSVLYGPNTMGGVVNILSKKPDKPLDVDFRMGTRQNGTADSSLHVGSKLDKFYFTVDGSFLDSHGYPMSNGFTPTPNQGDGTRYNSDINELTGGLKLGFTPVQGHEYAVGINTISSEWGLPPDVYAARPKYWRFTEWNKTTYYLIGDSKITDELSTKIRLYRDTYYNVLDSYDDASYSGQTKKYAFHSTYDDYTNGASIVIPMSYIPSNKLSFSFHYRNDVHNEQDDSSAAWEKYEEEIFSYGLEDDYKILDNLSLVAGVGYDVQKPTYANGGELRDDDTSFNPQAGLYWTCLQDLGLHLSVGKKSRFPTLKELYSGYFGRNLPNPDLETEESINYEIGAEKPLPWKNFAGINLFYSDIKNLIVNKEVQQDVYQYQNIGKAAYSGLELTFRSEFIPKNSFELSYTYLNAENKSSDRTSDHIEDAPEHKVYLSDCYELTEWLSFFGKLEWYAKRWYQDYDTGEWKTLGGFMTMDLKAIGTITENLIAEGGVKNLFDENYSLSYGFPREGRTFFASLRVTF